MVVAITPTTWLVFTSFAHVCELQAMVDTGNGCLTQDTVYVKTCVKHSFPVAAVVCGLHTCVNGVKIGRVVGVIASTDLNLLIYLHCSAIYGILIA